MVMAMPTVTFETKCYEKDWRYVLDQDWLTAMIDHHGYPFTERVLYINNVKNFSPMVNLAQQRVDEGILTSYVVVEEHASDALAYFQIDKNSFEGGYYYSVSELVSLFLVNTDYVLHMSGDAILPSPVQWVADAISKLERMALFSTDMGSRTNVIWSEPKTFNNQFIMKSTETPSDTPITAGSCLKNA